MPNSFAQSVRQRGRLLGVGAGVGILVLSFFPALSQEPPTTFPGIRSRDGAPPAAGELGPGAERFRRLWPAVLEFRGRCAMQGKAGWKQFAAPQLQPRVDALDKEIWGELDVDDGWSYFFWLALFDVGHPTSEKPLVGFYHPWSDFWVLTQWQVDPQPQIVDVEILSGEWLRRRGEPPFDPNPDWLRRKEFPAERLARATVENIGGFDRLMKEEKPWWQLLQLPEQEEVVRKVNYPSVSLQLTTAFLRYGELAADDPAQPAVRAVAAAVQQFLEAGKAGTMAALLESADGTQPEVKQLLGPLPPRGYDRLAPVYWLADDRRAAAFLVPDGNVDFCVALAYERQGDDLRLVRVDLLNFPRLYATSETKVEK